MLRIESIDHREPGVAKQLYDLLQQAYAIEAKRIGVEYFPALHRTEQDILASSGTFHVIRTEGELAAAMELEQSDDALVIASLVVLPRLMGKGLGSALVRHAIAEARSRLLAVETAEANEAALALYEKAGFRVKERFAAADGFRLVRLQRTN